MGSSDQTGNELDEFVTETLRNNLLGLPLDLPTINMTRARERGHPAAQRACAAQIHAADQRRPAGAVHRAGRTSASTSSTPSRWSTSSPPTARTRRSTRRDARSATATTHDGGQADAARAIVDPHAGDTPPADAADFMFGTGAWANNADGVTTTGLDDVDLWVGGLGRGHEPVRRPARQHVQLRLPEHAGEPAGRRPALLPEPDAGMNLRTQLEGNSFAEMIQRNTDGTHTLKADAFATADCKFELGHTSHGDRRHGFASLGAARSPTTRPRTATRTSCSCASRTARSSTGRATPSTRPASTASRSTTAPPASTGSSAATTTTPSGAAPATTSSRATAATTSPSAATATTSSPTSTAPTCPKGGPGNDAIDGGPGDDILMGGDGQDFINGGANDNETFAGPGNDFVIAGQGADAVFGDGGDDWIQGGTGAGPAAGRPRRAVLRRPGPGRARQRHLRRPGRRERLRRRGRRRPDGAERGDRPQRRRRRVRLGVPPVRHRRRRRRHGDQQPPRRAAAPVVVNRDRWQETEADSGSAVQRHHQGHDDAQTPAAVGGAGVHRLRRARPGRRRPHRRADARSCRSLVDRRRRRGQVIAELRRRASARSPATSGATATSCSAAAAATPSRAAAATTSSTATAAVDRRGSASAPTRPTRPPRSAPPTSWRAGAHRHLRPRHHPDMTLQQAVFAGLVDPGNLVAVREINDRRRPTRRRRHGGVLRQCVANYTITRTPTAA